jgi:hypothetical protein
LAVLVGDKRIEQDAGLMQRIKELAVRDDDFLEALLETTHAYESGLKSLLSDEDLEMMVCERSEIASKLNLLISLSNLSEHRGEELLKNLYARIVEDHSDEIVLHNLADFQTAVKIFGNFVESKQDRESVMSLMLDLHKDELDCIGNRGNLREGTIANRVCHLRIAKLLQAQGISVEDSIAWVQRTCSKETDPQFDDTLSHVDRTTFVQFDQAVRQDPDMVRLMAVYPQLDWENGASRIVDDVIGGTREEHRSFVVSLLSELGLSEERQEKVAALFLLKDLRQGKLSRRVVSCGLLRLVGDDGSRETLERVIDALELTKDDGRRLRTIFRLREYVDLQSVIGTADFEGLYELRASVVAEAAKKFSQEFEFVDLSTDFDLNIEILVGAGLLGIYATLQKSYEGKVHPASLSALKETYRHIVLQDFHQWRYTQPASELQFGDLSEDERSGWIRLAEAVKVVSQPGSGTMLTESLAPILRDVRSHLSFNLSKWDLKIREDKQNDSATDRLKLKDEREMKIALALRDVSEYDLNLLPREELLARCRELKQRLLDIGEIQSARDMKEAIRLLAKNESQVQCSYTASETDDPVQLFNSGVFPRETCQSWRGGMYNECLISTVADGNKKLINVVDDQGRVVGRAIIKVMQLEDPNNMALSAIVVEPIYTLRANSAINMAVMQLVVQKAKMMGGMPIVMDNIHTMPAYMQRLIHDEGMNARNQIFSLKSVYPTGEFEYSDLFVGRLSRGEMRSGGRELTLLRFDEQVR